MKNKKKRISELTLILKYVLFFEIFYVNQKIDEGSNKDL